MELWSPLRWFIASNLRQSYKTFKHSTSDANDSVSITDLFFQWTFTEPFVIIFRLILVFLSFLITMTAKHRKLEKFDKAYAIKIKQPNLRKPKKDLYSMFLFLKQDLKF